MVPADEPRGKLRGRGQVETATGDRPPKQLGWKDRHGPPGDWGRYGRFPTYRDGGQLLSMGPLDSSRPKAAPPPSGRVSEAPDVPEKRHFSRTLNPFAGPVSHGCPQGRLVGSAPSRYRDGMMKLENDIRSYSDENLIRLFELDAANPITPITDLVPYLAEFRRRGVVVAFPELYK